MIDEAYAEYMANCRRFMRTINAHQVMDFGRNKPKEKNKVKNSKGENNGKYNDNTQHNGNFRFSDSFCDVVGIV